MSKILLLPGESGAGQITRSLFLGRQLRTHGHNVALAVDNAYRSFVSSTNLSVFPIRHSWAKALPIRFQHPFFSALRTGTKVFKKPCFLEYDGLSYAVPRQGYLSEKIVDHRFRQYEEIVRLFKPDLLIGDGHVLTALLGKKYSLPVMQITRLAEFAPAPEFFWWKSSDTRLVSPDGLAPFRSLLQEVRWQDLYRAEDLLRGDSYLIPANEIIEPVDIIESEVVFSGPLSGIEDSPVQAVPYFSAESSNQRRIFVTLGNSMPRRLEKEFYRMIIAAFAHRDYRLLVSSGRPSLIRRFRDSAPNIRFVNGVPQKACIQQSDLVIYGGSYTTTMNVLLSARPAIAIPLNSAQEGNGRRLERLGSGRTLLPHDRHLKPLVCRWPYGTYQMLGGFDLALQTEDILHESEQLLNQFDPERAQILAESLKEQQRKTDFSKLGGLR